ncbi:SRPBCC family protein [Gulosibacter sediminis]|uniref:SRPBCC family protein n=1 Tax=Gulosibacter sediminis TaxID=1729695 RepID=UPI0024AD9C39|nr:SRPBCC family protein [Gulosibacter sediminis]
MPVTDTTIDSENLTMTLVAEFAAPVSRVWQAFTTPEQLNRFFGPPTWPATFTEFDLRPGGKARYHMTGPKGETAAGAWEFLEVNEGEGFTVLDMFTDDDGNVQTELPQMRVTYAFEANGEGTRFTNVTYFESVEAIDEIVAMGGVEGSKLAFNQLDAVLQDLREFAEGKGTTLELLNETYVRITRLIHGPRHLVWRAYTEPELQRQWALGPDGWAMTVCDIDLTVGGEQRTEWAPVGDTKGEGFGFEGENLLIEPESRLVSTERMIGTEGPTNINDLHLYEEDGATLVTLVVEYESEEVRDMILATGMVGGMEESYARLERVMGGF